MIAPTKAVANLRQRMARKLSGQAHRHLPRARDRPAAPFGKHVRMLDLVVLRHDPLDVLDGRQAPLHRDQVVQRPPHQLLGDRRLGELRMREGAAQRAFEFADVRAYALGDVQRHVIRYLETARFGLLLQDGGARLQIRRLHFHRHPAHEPRHEAHLQAFHFARVAIACEHHLMLPLEHAVEHVEELLLRAHLVRKELDVVDQQHLHRAIALHHVLDRAGSNALHHVVHEPFGTNIERLLVRKLGVDLVANRMHQVRLAEADPAVQQQRIVGLAHVGGHLRGGRLRQLVRLAFHEAVEHIERIQAVPTVPISRRRPLLGAHSHRPSGCASALAAANRQFQTAIAIAAIRHQFGDATQVLLLHPIAHIAIGRDQHQAAPVVITVQRPDPRIELFRRQLLLKPLQTPAPSPLHRLQPGPRVVAHLPSHFSQVAPADQLGRACRYRVLGVPASLAQALGSPNSRWKCATKAHAVWQKNALF